MRYRFSAVLSFLLLVLLSSCNSGNHPAKELIALPADGPVLLVGEPKANLLEQLKSSLTKTSLTAGYRMLEEDSLFNYRNLVLLRPAADSLTAHRRTAVERFVLAGGRLLIVDDQPTVPYQWAWYEKMREKTTPSPFAHGKGMVLALMEKLRPRPYCRLPHPKRIASNSKFWTTISTSQWKWKFCPTAVFSFSSAAAK